MQQDPTAADVEVAKKAVATVLHHYGPHLDREVRNEIFGLQLQGPRILDHPAFDEPFEDADDPLGRIDFMRERRKLGIASCAPASRPSVTSTGTSEPPSPHASVSSW